MWFGLRRRRNLDPTAPHPVSPSTSHRRCQGWRRYGKFQQKRPRPSGPCRGQSLWRKVLLCTCKLYVPSAVAQLSVVIPSPTLQVPVVKNGAGVAYASRNRNGCSARAEVNCCGGRCCCVRGSCMLCSTVAQLSLVVSSPTLQVAVVKDGTGVGRTSRYRNGRAAHAEINRCG